MSDPVYVYRKGKGWVPMTPRTPDEIIGGYTFQKGEERSGRKCSTCGEDYGWHSGDSCDYPYNGREWTD